VEFHASARVDDQIEVAMKCSRIGTSSMTFTGAIFRGEEHLISCELVYVFADPVTQTSRPVPPALRDIVLGYEAGEAMVTMKVGGWSELGDDARRIRTAVFVEEQRIPKDLESDAADLTAVHAVAYNRLGQPVATGRFVPHEPGVVKVGRLAVHRVLRGGHLGRQVLMALMDAARDGGEREVMLHAQRSAVGFYERLGYQARGASFEEAGIEHQEMFKPLG
jgi:predicted GNAT family N-acyltransferase